MLDRMEDERPTDAVAALFLDESDPNLPEPSLGPGTVVSGYVIDAQIGKGATGVVYSATHPKIGKRVAIKVLRLDLCDDPISVERFTLEARAVNSIGHPNIVDIFDLGALPDGRQYLVMDLLVGQTLRKRLGTGPLSPADTATVLDDCASALIAAHAKGFIHRDLKPDNVFLAELPGRSRPEARLLDFGVVKLVEGAYPSGAGIRTQRGVVIGTPQYMSPEQAKAKHVDHRTDIYALGVMAFELLAGHRPYEHKNILDLLILHAEAPIPPLRDRAPAVPEEVAQLVEAMLAKRPDDRPTLTAVRTVLERLPRTSARMDTPPLVPKPSGPITRIERPVRSDQLLQTTPVPARKSAQGSAAVAMQMAATPASPSIPSLPKVIPKGTPSKTEQVPAAALDDEVPVHSSSRTLWLLFAIAAVLISVGGVLLGMSL
jgi:eukaryotic-like serine/threonine-protein kinase